MKRWLSGSALAVALAFAPLALADGDGFVKVIAPGNEKLIGDMLGTGVDLPGGCKLASASIDRTRVVAHYACGKDVVVELHHPSDGEGAAIRTARFALVPKGEAPAELMTALAERIKAREEPWRWISAESPGLASVGDTPTPVTDQPSSFHPRAERALRGRGQALPRSALSRGLSALPRPRPDHARSRGDGHGGRFARQHRARARDGRQARRRGRREARRSARPVRRGRGGALLRPPARAERARPRPSSTG
jgi:hypothetical protein